LARIPIIRVPLERKGVAMDVSEERSLTGLATDTLRLNGDRYVTGAVRYLDDGITRNHLHLAFLRSPHAHARIRGIDTAVAVAQPGVHAILTGADVSRLMRELACRTPAALTKTDSVLTVPCLAVDHARYCGEPVALVVANSELVARRVGEMIVVDYEVLTPMLDVHAATAAHAVLQHPALSSNVVMSGKVADGDAALAIAAASLVLEGRVVIGRSSAIALEPRGCIASWDNEQRRLVVRAAVQQPHTFRAALAQQLKLPESDIQVVTPPLGGAFGFKFIGLPEEALTCLMALQLKRSVRWVESRAESLLIGARDYEMNYRIGFSANGVIEGLQVDLDANIGALAATPGPLMPIVAASTFPGPYNLQHLEIHWRAVMTNKGPWNGARGFGKEATCVLLESVLDDAARKLGVDRVEIRRRNLLRPEQFPHRTSTMTIDSGNYQRALDIVVELSDYAKKSLRPPDDGARKRRGLGIAFELTPEGSDAGGTLSRGFETATVRIDTSGYATVLTGVTSPGTGSETAIAQLVAMQLGIQTINVRVVQGDTDTTPYGSGSFSSRAVLAGGTAAWLAAGELREKLKASAAVFLGAPVEDIEVNGGSYRVRSEPARGMPIGELVLGLRTLGSALPGLGDPQLEATRTYGPGNLQSIPDSNGRLQLYPTYSYSVVVAEVEVDLDTGCVKLIALSAVHDCGTVINQGLVDAQFHGALVMGIGMALTEEERYDTAGIPIDNSFKKYLLPRLKDLPLFRIGHLDSPSPFTALGTKGAGESGVGASAAAIVSAIEDAVDDPDPLPVTLPLTPQRVLARLDHAASASLIS
jgi:carbon-monoxide dehydrogenase large subunit